MSAFSRLVLGVALALALSAPARAFTSGVWEGGPDKDEDGRFIDCTMTAQSGSGILLAFVISREGAWGLALADERWSLNVGAVQDIELTIDGAAPIKAIAKVVDPHGILVPLADDDSLIMALRQGSLLSISTGSGTFRFELAGTNEALAALSSCVTENLGAERVKDGVPPRGQHPDEVAAVDARPHVAAQDRDNRLFSQTEASAFATALLASAGVSGYRLADVADNPMPSFDVVWTYANGIVGALAGFKAADAVDLDAAAATVTADDARNCHGEYTSGLKPSRREDGDRVKRFFTACRGRNEPVEIHYTLIRTAGGNLIQIAHLNRGDGSLDAADADTAFLAADALKTVR